MALPGQLGGQVPKRLRCPPQRRHRVTPLVRLDQRQQRRSHPRVSRGGGLAPPPCPPHTLIGQRPFPGLQLEHSLADGRLAHPSHPRDGPYPAMTQQPRLSGQRPTPLTFVQMRQQHPDPRRQLLPPLGGHAHTTSTSHKIESDALFPYSFDARRRSGRLCVATRSPTTSGSPFNPSQTRKNTSRTPRLRRSVSPPTQTSAPPPPAPTGPFPAPPPPTLQPDPRST